MGLKAEGTAKLRWADFEDDGIDNEFTSWTDCRKECALPDPAKRCCPLKKKRNEASHKTAAISLQPQAGQHPRVLSDFQRHDKRSAYVAGVQETQGYKVYLEKLRAGDKKAAKVPGAPNPYAPCSKREWETQTTAWRQALRKFGDVTVPSKEASI